MVYTLVHGICSQSVNVFQRAHQRAATDVTMLQLLLILSTTIVLHVQ